MMDYLYGATGDHVTELQKAVLTMGGTLDKWGADGNLGGETWTAIEMFVGGGELPEDAPLPETVVEIILEAARERLGEGMIPLSADVLYSDITDLSGQNRKGIRPWHQIDSIVLHQTGCMMSNASWKTLRAHIGIPREEIPKVILCNPLTSYMWHANSFNSRSIGIEINGNFSGIEGDLRYWWRKGGGHKTVGGTLEPWTVTRQQIKATRAAIRWIQDNVTAKGGQIKYVYAHRQASKNRRADPGQLCWQEIGAWAERELGLGSGGVGYTSGGYPIPGVWSGDIHSLLKY